MRKTYHIPSDQEADDTIRLKNIHASMLARCTNEKNREYPKYGGRGIKVYEPWIESFHDFRKWALTHGYDPKLSLDRINVDGHYYPTNLRWATASMQVNNRREYIHIGCKSMRMWCLDRRIDYQTAYKDLKEDVDIFCKKYRIRKSKIFIPKHEMMQKIREKDIRRTDA